MCLIFLLFLVFQSFCISQILGIDYCDYNRQFESYLDVAVDVINKAKSYLPENAILPQEELHRPMDCEGVLRSGFNQSGVYTIWPRNRLTDGKPLKVYCDMDTDGGGWTVIQRRGRFNKTMLFFFQDWETYKKGFGDIEEDFWLGNDNIFALTNQREYSIRFDLMNKKGEKKYALYDIFWIDDEDRKYVLHIQNYSGDAGNSMASQHVNQKFSTKDQDNDSSDDNCSQTYRGGWWYGNCCHVNLNGIYYKIREYSVDGIMWLTITGPNESLETTEMKIRPMKFKTKFNPKDTP